MKKIVRLLMCCVPLIILAACGGGDGGGGAAAPAGPTVVSTVPPNGAVGVSTTTVISATFSEAMNPATFSNISTTTANRTFVVKDANNNVVAAADPANPVQLDTTTNKTATFIPATFLLPNTTYTVTIKGGTGGVKSAAGVALANPNSNGNYVWSFTTRQTQVYGSIYNDQANGIATDALGNVLLAGFTNGSLDDNGLNVNPDTSGNTSDILIVKYGAAFNKIWRHQIASPFQTYSGSRVDYNDRANGAATVANGDIVVAGYTDGTLPLSAQTNPDLSGRTHNYFVLKYTAGGAQAWITQAGAGANGPNPLHPTYVSNIARGVAVDASGNVYVAGNTNGNLRDPLAGTGFTTNYAGGSTDAFVAKYDSAGNLLWTRLLGTTGNDDAFGVATDGTNVYVTGTTTGGFPTFTNAGPNDIFLAKYDTSGNLVTGWPVQFGTAQDDHVNAITIDGSGNLYIAGGTFGGLSGSNHGPDPITTLPSTDLFVARINTTTGARTWITQLGTAYNDEAFGLATDSSGNIYVTGYTSGSLDTTTANAGTPDIFTVKLNSGGATQFIKQLGTPQTDVGKAIAAFSPTTNNLYVTGYTQGDLDGSFNADPTFNTTDYFLLRYDTSGNKF
jgi:hypothetical protein